ncbi:type VI secretion system contractile sheath large subunit, partial [uncultured Pseudoalteromonas sp.]
MSAEQLSTELESTAETSSSLLEQAIGATKQTDASRAEELLKTLTEEALKGTVQWNKNMTVTFNEAIQLIDQKISKQLSVVMHSDEFQKLEGSWRGLHHLVMNSETSSTLKIRVLNMKKKELHKDLSKAV